MHRFLIAFSIALIALMAVACQSPCTANKSDDTSDTKDLSMASGGKADSISTHDLDMDHRHGKIPLTEVSGLAVRTIDGTRQLLAIGDAEPSVVVAPLPSSINPSKLEFARYDMAHLHRVRSRRPRSAPERPGATRRWGHARLRCHR